MCLNADMRVQIRLTFNYWRKGGYTVGSEDYRWYVWSRALFSHLEGLN